MAEWQSRRRKCDHRKSRLPFVGIEGESIKTIKTYFLKLCVGERIQIVQVNDVDQSVFGDLGLFGAEFLEQLLTEILQLGIALPTMKGIVLKSPKWETFRAIFSCFGWIYNKIFIGSLYTRDSWKCRRTSRWMNHSSLPLYREQLDRRYLPVPDSEGEDSEEEEKLHSWNWTLVQSSVGPLE